MIRNLTNCYSRVPRIQSRGWPRQRATDLKQTQHALGTAAGVFTTERERRRARLRLSRVSVDGTVRIHALAYFSSGPVRLPALARVVERKSKGQWQAMHDRDAAVFKFLTTIESSKASWASSGEDAGLPASAEPGYSHKPSSGINEEVTYYTYPMVVVTRAGAVVLLGCDSKTAVEVLEHLYDPAIAQPVQLRGKKASDYLKIVVDPRPWHSESINEHGKPSYNGSHSASSAAHDLSDRASDWRLSPDRWAAVHPQSGELHIRDMDVEAARVIGMVFGQSVMLQHYEQSAERLYDVVQMVNSYMLGGSLGRQNVRRLRSALATNSRMADLVAMHGQRDLVRPGTAAWRDPRLYELSQELAVDLELEQRFEELRHKLDFVKGVIRFSLGQRQEDAILRLEWLIVLLLTLELLLTAGELGGKMVEADGSGGRGRPEGDVTSDGDDVTSAGDGGSSWEGLRFLRLLGRVALGGWHGGGDGAAEAPGSMEVASVAGVRGGGDVTDGDREEADVAAQLRLHRRWSAMPGSANDDQRYQRR